MMLRAHYRVVLATVLGACGFVRADDGAGLRPAGTVDVSLTIESRADGQRASLAPAVWYGLSDRLTLGLASDYSSRDRFGAGRGLCLAGCQPADPAFAGLDVAARFPLVYGPSRLTGEVATDIAGWSPARAALRMSVLGERRGDAVYARLRGELSIGLLGRADGNRDLTGLAFTVGRPIAGPLGAELTAGVDGPATDGFFGELRTPAGVRTWLRPGGAWSATLSLGTDDLRVERDVFATLSVEVRVAS